MSKNLTNAMSNVEVAYQEVIDISNDIVKEMTGDITLLIENTYNNIETLTNEDIRQLLLRLALRSYSFGEIKDKSAFKAALAESLRKEAYAKEFNAAEGTVAAKENTATINISSEIVVEEIYELTASLLKTRADEIHRVVDALKSVLTTRLTEAKLTSIDTE